MSHKVSSPKQSRIPDFFSKDQVVREYVEYQRDVLYKLWVRTGGGFDAVAANKIISISSDTVLDNTAYGSIIVVDASSGTVQVTLPTVDSHDLGQSVIITVTDASFDTTVIPVTGTILGAANLVISTAYVRSLLSPITTSVWV